MNDLWTTYTATLAIYHAKASAATASAVIAAYAAWCRRFCPDDAEPLISAFSARIGEGMHHAA